MSERFNEVVTEAHKVLAGIPVTLKNLVHGLLLDAYEAGIIEDALDLSRYGCLTAAHQLGKKIDYPELEGKKVILVCKDGCCRVQGKLSMYATIIPERATTVDSWAVFGATDFPLTQFVEDWVDIDWWLWVEGELPIVSKTANELPVGMVFRGVWDGNDTEDLFILCKRGDGLTVTSPNGSWGFLEPERVTVLEEYGVGVLPS